MSLISRPFNDLFEDKSQDNNPLRPQSHINLQHLIGRSISEERLPGGAADLVGSSVGEHSPSSLVAAGSVDDPVPINDGSARSALKS